MTLREREGRAGIETMDQEHRVHLELMKSLETAVGEGAAAARLGEILDQLLDFSRVHFLSEQLLMRLHAYPAYEAHEEEHDRMTADLHALRDRLDRDGELRDPTALAALQETLARHILLRDRELTQFLAGVGEA
jgi:hemerythrin